MEHIKVILSRYTLWITIFDKQKISGRILLRGGNNPGQSFRPHAGLKPWGSLKGRPGNKKGKVIL